MTERTPRDRQPTDESAAQVRRASAHDWLDDMRAARRAERAPDDVRQRLLERARELGQSVEGHAASLPFGVEPVLSLGLLNERLLKESLLDERLLDERLLDERALAGRPLSERRQAQRLLVEAWAHPLVARVAGAGLMIGLVVLVIADVRRPSGSALSTPELSTPELSIPGPSIPASAPPDVSLRALATETPAAPDSSSEPPGVGVLRERGDMRPELSGLAERFSRALLGSAPQPAASRVEAASRTKLPDSPRPRDAAPPWLSPHAALSALRAVTMPYLEGAPSYPEGTRVLARGNVRPDIRPGSARNLITNGDFSRGDVMWSVRSWQGFGDTSVAAYYSVQAGALCTTLERNRQVLGGWPWDDRRLSPSSFDLERGKRYRLSLRAWSSGPEAVQLVVKVGHQQPPYSPALMAKVPVTAEPGRFDIDFVASRSDTSSGFAFVATSPPDQPVSEFCIDDVSVRRIDGGP